MEVVLPRTDLAWEQFKTMSHLGPANFVRADDKAIAYTLT